jgi:hypothetical protein
MKKGKEWLDSLSEKDRNEIKKNFSYPNLFEYYMEKEMTFRDFISGALIGKVRRKVLYIGVK